MNAALKQLREQGVEVKSEYVEQLSPLGYEHINFLRRYSVTLTESVEKGPLPPLRNPEEEELES